MKKKTTEQFITESENIHGYKYDYSLVEYKNNKTKVKIICHIHGVFEQLPGRHSIGNGCRYCAHDKNKLTKNEFLKRSEEIHGNKYDYSLVNYNGNRTNVEIICHKHGVFEQMPEKHLIGHGCQICGGNNTLSTKQFIQKSKKIHGDKYDYSLVKYKNHTTKVEIICPEHGIIKQLPLNHLKGYGCYKCIGRYESLENIIEKFKQIHGNKYDYSLVNTNKKRIKISIICSEHGIFKQTLGKHLIGNGCPICKESKGEKKIRLFLNNKKFIFIIQKMFNNCKNKNPLPFDFYLPNDNLCIEYDGIQHFKKNEFFGGIDGFNKLKKNDQIKNLYCEKNNIDLIRISYQDYNNIENILKNKLEKYETINNFNIQRI